MCQPIQPRPAEPTSSDTTIAITRAAVTAAADAADWVAARHAEQRCRLAALLVAALLPAAATLVFDHADDTVTADTVIAPVHIRAGDGTLLWYDTDSAFAAHRDAQALGVPPALDGAMLGDIGRQLGAACDASPGRFPSSDDGAEVMLGANLLVLSIPAAAIAAVAPAGRQVLIEAPGRPEQRFLLAGDDTLLVLVDGEPAFGVDQHGPGRWYGEVWQRVDPAGQLMERSVSIEGIATAAMWQELEAALGLDRHKLGRFKPWTVASPKYLSDSYDLDAAVAWARQCGLTYEDERRVRVPAGAGGVGCGLAGQPVHVLEWDRGEHGVSVYMRASRRGALALRDELIREHWDTVSCYAEVPDQPPAEAGAALRIWQATNHNHADPDVGVFSVSTVVIAD
jgi:hypothetical protein